MRILVVNYEYPPIGGGGGFVTRDFAEAWVKAGHEVTVVTSRYHYLLSRENVEGVNVVRVPVLMRNREQTASHMSMLSYVPSAISRCLVDRNFRNFDVINTHFAVPSGPVGHYLAKQLNLPNVLSIHGGDIFDPSKSLSPHKTPLLRSTVRAMLKKADRVVAQSTDTFSNAHTYYHPDRAIDIIPLGIKKPVFDTKTRCELGLSDEDSILCTIGRLVKRKNLTALLDAISLLEQKDRLKLLIIGDGPERKNLEDRIAGLKLQDQVIFCGAVDDERKFQLLECADLYVSTALHEGFGLVFVEAMECGLPVVCFNRGGQTDFLTNGKTGYLVDLGDVDSFSKRLAEMRDDSVIRAEMSRFCRSYVENFYIETCAARYIDLFRELIDMQGSEDR